MIIMIQAAKKMTLIVKINWMAKVKRISETVQVVVKIYKETVEMPMMMMITTVKIIAKSVRTTIKKIITASKKKTTKTIMMKTKKTKKTKIQRMNKQTIMVNVKMEFKRKYRSHKKIWKSDVSKRHQLNRKTLLNTHLKIIKIQKWMKNQIVIIKTMNLPKKFLFMVKNLINLLQIIKRPINSKNQVIKKIPIQKKKVKAILKVKTMYKFIWFRLKIQHNLFF